MEEQLLIRISKKFLLTTSCVIKGEKAKKENSYQEWRIDAMDEQLLIRISKKFLLTTSCMIKERKFRRKIPTKNGE